MLSQALRLRQLLKVGSAGQEILDNGDDGGCGGDLYIMVKCVCVTFFLNLFLDKIILGGVNFFLCFFYFFVIFFWGKFIC